MRAFLFALTLAGCASLQPGISTESQVLASLGEPAARFRDPDGGATWAYPHGPLGFETFMARFASSGRLIAIDGVLHPLQFARVIPGLDRDQVQRLIGPPGNVAAFPRRGEMVWDYRFMDTWGMPSQFSVIFDAEWRVKSTLTWRELIDMQD